MQFPLFPLVVVVLLGVGVAKLSAGYDKELMRDVCPLRNSLFLQCCEYVSDLQRLERAFRRKSKPKNDLAKLEREIELREELKDLEDEIAAREACEDGKKGRCRRV